MGTVYRATLPGTERIIALKILNPSEPLGEFVEDEALCDIFSTEARTMAGFNHPHIARVLDIGSYRGRPFYTMEYFCANLGMLMGEAFVMEEPTRLIPPDKAVNYADQVLSALECLHKAGLVHRDIKPHNMMLAADDTIRICDFGMVKLDDEDPVPASAMIIGTPYYTPPEQLSDPDNTDARADLYSTGILLYRMLTGELPTMKDFMLSHVSPSYDHSWDDFFARSLSWKPDLRFRSAAEMRRHLHRLELHREKKANRRANETDSPTPEKFQLRSSCRRVSGVKARETFAVNTLWQPLTVLPNRFTCMNDQAVLDEATGLIWQRMAQDPPLDRQSAEDLVNVLNEVGFSGIANWRLPTVNELLSLSGAISRAEKTAGRDAFLLDNGDWLWSCDRRSPKTSWFVNTRIGFTGWQHDTCLFSMRAVADLHP